jgi:hypothetical protein
MREALCAAETLYRVRFQEESRRPGMAGMGANRTQRGRPRATYHRMMLPAIDSRRLCAVVRGGGNRQTPRMA